MEGVIDVTLRSVLDPHWTVNDQSKLKDNLFKVTGASLCDICCCLGLYSQRASACSGVMKSVL